MKYKIDEAISHVLGPPSPLAPQQNTYTRAWIKNKIRALAPASHLNQDRLYWREICSVSYRLTRQADQVTVWMDVVRVDGSVASHVCHMGVHHDGHTVHPWTELTQVLNRHVQATQMAHVLTEKKRVDDQASMAHAAAVVDHGSDNKTEWDQEAYIDTLARLY